MRILKNLFACFRPSHKRRPRVLADFLVKDAGIYLTICNLSPHTACQVCLRFDESLKYFNGCKRLENHPIVQRIPYLASFKSIEIFLDPIDIFFYHLSTDDLCIDLKFEDEKGRCFQKQYHHDLSIYRSLPNHSRVEFLIK